MSFTADSLTEFVFHYPIQILAVSAFTAWVSLRSKSRTSNIEKFYSSHPEPLPRNGSEKSAGEGLISLMQRKMPSVFSEGATFAGVPWLPNGDAQTIFASVGDFSNVDPVDYERIHVNLSDDGLQAIDVTPSFALRPHQPGETVVLVVHGLSGGSNEPYVRAVLAVLCAPKSQGGLGMRGVVMNSRGCNGSPITTPQLYNAGSTDDISHAVLWVSKNFPGSQLFGIGFSLGANAITDYAGQEGENCPLSGVISVANPFDFVASNHHIETANFFTKYVYNYALGGALHALVSRHLKVFLEDKRSKVPVDQLKEYIAKPFSTLRDFDEATTKFEFGFTSAYDYYAHVSSARFVHSIRVPFMGLNSLDDPITGPHTLPICHAMTNPLVLLVRTPHGGHLGWFEYGPDRKVRRWYVQPIKEWFSALVEYNLKPRPSIQFEEVNGRITRKDRPDISIRVLAPEEIPPSVPVTNNSPRSAVSFQYRLMSKLFTGW